MVHALKQALFFLENWRRLFLDRHYFTLALVKVPARNLLPLDKDMSGELSLIAAHIGRRTSIHLMCPRTLSIGPLPLIVPCGSSIVLRDRLHNLIYHGWRSISFLNKLFLTRLPRDFLSILRCLGEHTGRPASLVI